MVEGPATIQVDLGPMPVDAHNGCILDGLRGFLEKQEFCDVVLIAGGQSFFAHRTVLAAVSMSFHECLMRLASNRCTTGLAGGPNSNALVLKLDDITHPEAVQAMLDRIYESNEGGGVKDYHPTTDEVNWDVLRLAQRFQIAQLQDHASQWLAKGLTTSNVPQRLVTCEEFGLNEVREKILGQVTANPEALFALAKDPEIVKAPMVLQDLLVRILQSLGLGKVNSQHLPSVEQTKSVRQPGKKAGA